MDISALEFGPMISNRKVFSPQYSKGKRMKMRFCVPLDWERYPKEIEKKKKLTLRKKVLK